MVDVGATGATACDRVGFGCGRNWRRRRRRAGTELQTEVRSRLRVLALGAGCSRSRVGQDGGSGFLGSHGQSWECDRNTRPMRQMGCDGSEMKSFPKCLRWKRPWVNCCSSHLVMSAQVQDGIRGPRRNAPVRIAIASAQVGRSIGELAVIVHRRHSWVIRGGMGS